jgi:hypothetical protein
MLMPEQQKIQYWITRKFTRTLIREALRTMSMAYLSTKESSQTDIAQMAGWFATHNVPIKWSHDEKTFKVFDPTGEFVARLIPEDDETLLKALNDLQTVVFRTTPAREIGQLPDEDPTKIKMLKIIMYLEANGYSVERKGNKYHLKGISE